MLLISIWLAIVPCGPVRLPDAVYTESIVWLYRRKDNKRKNAYSGVTD